MVSAPTDLCQGPMPRLHKWAVRSRSPFRVKGSATLLSDLGDTDVRYSLKTPGKLLCILGFLNPQGEHHGEFLPLTLDSLFQFCHTHIRVKFVE